jgi:curved DNA-binding protein
MEFKDYYKIMGVAENADTDAIRKAYRKLARKYHPDVSTEADAEQHFKEVGEAYEVLKDKDKRTEYDQLRKLGARGRDCSFRPPPGWQARNGGQQTSADGDFSDFFSSIFGGFGGAQQAGHSTARQAFRRRGEDVHSTLALLLDEAHQGGDKPISFQVQDSDEQGHLRRRRKTLKVKIPAGVTRGPWIITSQADSSGGHKLRLAGKGLSKAGDLIVILRISMPKQHSDQARELYRQLATETQYNPRTDWGNLA